MVAAAVEKNRCLTTRYLASALAYLILLLGSFFTLIWGWNNSPVINATAAKHWFTARAIPLIVDPPLSPNFDPADFFPFPKLKEQLAGLSFAQESLEKTWGGVSRNITAKTLAVAFCRWFEGREKYVRIGGDHAKKS